MWELEELKKQNKTLSDQLKSNALLIDTLRQTITVTQTMTTTTTKATEALKKIDLLVARARKDRIRAPGCAPRGTQNRNGIGAAAHQQPSPIGIASVP